MNGIILEQGFLGDGESPNHRVPPHRGGRRLPQKPPSLLGGSSLIVICDLEFLVTLTDFRKRGKSIQAPSGVSPKPGPSPNIGIFDGP